MLNNNTLHKCSINAAFFPLYIHCNTQIHSLLHFNIKYIYQFKKLNYEEEVGEGILQGVSKEIQGQADGEVKGTII